VCRTGCETAVWISLPKMTKYAGKFHFEIQATDKKTAKKNLRGILFTAPVCYTNSSLVLADIYTCISLRFTQSNSPIHTKSLFSFRNTRISRISRQSVSASSCKPSTHRENTFHLGLQLQVFGPAWKSVDGLPVICFRR